jgi:hypothetical protein
VRNLQRLVWEIPREELAMLHVEALDNVRRQARGDALPK